MKCAAWGLVVALGVQAQAALAQIAPVASQPPVDTRPVAAARLHSALPEGWEHGAFMEIFVRAWRDSDGDGIGDLRGLTQSLDYLQELGIRGIWLMPITRNADGDHGYATTDHRAIAPDYGSLADFDELIAQAHRRGIGVIMDYVVNHSAAANPLFEQARLGPGNPWRDWYVWSDSAPQGWDIWGKDPWYHVGSQPWLHTGEVKDLPKPPPGARGFYFGTFGPHMPDFNLRNPEVVAYHASSLRFWLNRGLDGYRLDAVPHMIENDAVRWNDQPESRTLTKSLQDLIKAYPHRMVVCEATAEPQAYGDPAVCGGAFAFGYVHHIVQAARGDLDSVRRVADYYRTARSTMATFVSNHDIFAGQRLWDQLEGDEARYKVAAATYLLQPGTPFVYYGEEIGQAGVPGLAGDLPIRSPMSWSAEPARAGFTRGTPFRPVSPNAATHNVEAERRDPNSILRFYQGLIGLRNTWPSIARGGYEGAFVAGAVAGWQRRLGDETTLVVINYGTSGAEVEVPSLPAGARLQPLWPARAAPGRAGSAGLARLWLAPLSVRVFALRP
jgi:glycosidase